MLDQLLSSHLWGLQLDDIQEADDTIVLWLTATRALATCPVCHHSSCHVQSRYQRVLADVACFGITVRLCLHVRRFFCCNPACSRQIFCERLPDLVMPSARCTQRLADLQQQVALQIGGEVGQRLLRRFGIHVSADTLLRRSRQPSVSIATPRVLGVDDYAVRKGQRYGTILVDLERHCPVDLLPDRSASTLEEWLTSRPGIEVIARDRATDYAEGARRGAPQAVQVADRFHLLQNVKEMLQRLLERQQQALRQATAECHDEAADTKQVTEIVTSGEPSARDAASPPANTGASGGSRTAVQAHLRRAERVRRYETVKGLHAQGVSRREIARRVGVGRNTVRRWLGADQFPERGTRRRSGSKLDPFVPYLEQQLTAGHDNGMQLWREIRDHQHYAGSRALVSHWVAHHRYLCPPVASRPKRRGRPPAKALTSAPAKRTLSARQAAWLLMRQPTELDADEHAVVDRLCQTVKDVQVSYGLAQEFNQIVRERLTDAFPGWLKRAEASGISEVRSLVAGLRRDYEAVLGALRLPFSTGQVEGQINRLKTIKRSAYGRAKHDLLRQRVLAA